MLTSDVFRRDNKSMTNKEIAALIEIAFREGWEKSRRRAEIEIRHNTFIAAGTSITSDFLKSNAKTEITKLLAEDVVNPAALKQHARDLYLRTFKSRTKGLAQWNNIVERECSTISFDPEKVPSFSKLTYAQQAAVAKSLWDIACRRSGNPN